MKKLIILLCIFISMMTFSKKYEKYEYKFQKNGSEVIFNQYELLEPININDVIIKKPCTIENDYILITIDEDEVRKYYDDPPKRKICKNGKVFPIITGYLFNNIENVKIYDKIKEQDVSKVYYAKGHMYWFPVQRKTVTRFKMEYMVSDSKEIVVDGISGMATVRLSEDFLETREDSEELTEEEKEDWRRIKANVEKVKKIPHKTIYDEDNFE